MYFIILIVNSFGMFSLAGCSQPFVFLSQPGDQAVHEGESASFPCSIRSNDNFHSCEVFWENSFTQRVVNGEDFTIKTMCNLSNQTVSSELVIVRVRRNMTLLYRCSILLLNEDPSKNTIIPSEFGSLNVQFFLEENDLQCINQNGNVVQEGNEVLARCTATQCNPRPKLQWIGLDSQNINSTTEVNDDRFTTALHFIASRQVHGKEIYCVATSQAFPDISINCSVGPYSVLHVPVVRIRPRYTELMPPFVTEVTLYCSTTAFPAVNTFRWSCQPSYAISDCESFEQNFTLAIKRNLNLTIYVSCETTNLAGTSSARSIIRIRQNNDFIEQCKFNKTFDPLSENHPQIVYENRQHFTVFNCHIEVGDMNKVIFRWYCNGYIFSEETGIPNIKQSIDGYHLYAQSSIQVAEVNVIACKVSHAKSASQSTSCAMSDTLLVEPNKRCAHVIRAAGGSTTVHASTSTDESSSGILSSDFSMSFLKTIVIVVITVAVGLLLIISLVLLLRGKGCYNHDRGTSRGNNSKGTRDEETVSAFQSVSMPELLESPSYEIPEIPDHPGRLHDKSYFPSSEYDRKIFSRPTSDDFENSDELSNYIKHENTVLSSDDDAAPNMSRGLHQNRNRTLVEVGERRPDWVESGYTEDNESYCSSCSVQSSPHHITHEFLSRDGI